MEGRKLGGRKVRRCGFMKVKAEVLVAQSCPTLCDPRDSSSPDASVHGILQARILKRVAMPSSRGSSQPWSPPLQVDSLPSERPGEPNNTGVGRLSLL